MLYLLVLFRCLSIFQIDCYPSLQYFKDDQGCTNLYAKKAPTWWTLPYWCQRQPPEGTFLRLTPVYGTADKQQEVIQRFVKFHKT